MKLVAYTEICEYVRFYCEFQKAYLWSAIPPGGDPLDFLEERDSTVQSAVACKISHSVPVLV